MTDIIVFAGQSNMQGECECLLDSSAVVGAREYTWLTDEAVMLADPVGENIKSDGTAVDAVVKGKTDVDRWLDAHIAGSSVNGCSTLVPAFCRSYISPCGHDVLAVHYAKGSTVIADWMPGTAAYGMMVKKILAAKAILGSEGTDARVMLVWLHGESDAIYKTGKETYKSRLTAFKDALKADAMIDIFGVIRVGRFTDNEYDGLIISAQDEVCREDGDFLMLTEIAAELYEIPECMNPNVHGHYSALGLRRLGEAAGKVLAEYAQK